MLQPLEQVRDHQNPLAHTPALASCQSPQLRSPRFAAKEVYRHCPSPKTWYTRLTALPYLGITGNRYYTHDRVEGSVGSSPRPRMLAQSPVQYLGGSRHSILGLVGEV